MALKIATNKSVDTDGKIIKILDEYNLVINLGAKNVEVGDKVLVYEKASEVIDPDTNEILGTIDLVKAKLRVTEVFEKFSICYTDEKETNNMFSNILPIFGTTTYFPLKVNDFQNERLILKDEIISIGDPIKIIDGSLNPNNTNGISE